MLIEFQTNLKSSKAKAGRKPMRTESSCVRISGGLGNQLFQYAFSRVIMIETQSPVQLDIERYSLENARKCEIANLFPEALFSNSMRIFAMGIFSKILPNRIKHKLLAQREGRIRKCESFMGRKVVLEKITPYDASIPLQVENYYVGNFISPEYWHRNQKRLLEEIDRAISFSACSAGTLLPSENTIAVHIRRGDYLENKKTRDFHGYCKDSYYIEAVESLRAIHQSLDTVLISSDDEDCARYFSSKIQAVGFQVSILENLDPTSTLYVLSRAHYFVGSNSTFSWWGAYLGNQKLSVFPRNWFMDEKIDINPDHFFPISPILITDALTSEPNIDYKVTGMVER